ncbi:MAG: carboxypeptidase regulatory-like domain-containing protein [Deltaproteobacteria bacterium]|nr:carboxypeptidase regulatory-like domain-containing protein [Deltaproteobacteria bacterium]
MALSRWPALAVPLLFLAACSGDEGTDADGDGIADGINEPNNVTVIAPTKPTGYVAGEVRDAATDRPLVGATVKLIGGGIEGEGTTDDLGTFRLGPIAAGATFAVRITAPGKVEANITGLSIDDAAGNFPTQNGAIYVGPVSLIGDDGKFAVMVVGEDGTPVDGASVAIETAASHFVAGVARSGGIARGETDVDGLAEVEGLPNVFALPPRLEAAAALTIQVSPVDLDGDERADLDGAVLAIGGREARSQAQTPVIVLRRPGAQALLVVASNIPGLAGTTPAQPAILPAVDSNLRIVFNKPIDRDSVLVDLRNEDATDTILTAEVTSGLDNVLTIDPAENLTPGQEYNVAVRVHSKDSSPTEVLQLAAAFFVADNRDTPIVVAGRFADLNGDQLWGTGNDVLYFAVSQPVGRAAANPAFVAEVWVNADLNGDAVVGNAQGELPNAGQPYPPPLLLNAAEPAPGNGAPGSGYTRFIAPLGINLFSPLGQASGAIGFELRLVPERNDGRFVTTPSGREAPAIFTASAALVAR